MRPSRTCRGTRQVREVQLAFIANDTLLQALVNRPVHAPFFWAGFTLTGATDPIREIQ